MARVNAHHLPAPEKNVVAALTEGKGYARRLDLAREHGAAVIDRLEGQGHLVEGLSGTLSLSPLTLRELDRYSPWKDEEIAILRRNWHSGVSIIKLAASLKRTGGDVLQKAWEQGLDRSRKPVPADEFNTYVPAWRVRRLRLQLVEAERRGIDPRDDGTDISHRALRRRFNGGRASIQRPLNDRQPWSRQDVKTLQRMQGDGHTIGAIARVLKRTVPGVSSKLTSLGFGIRKHDNWTYEEDSLLAEGIAEGLSNRAIAEKLKKRTVKSIKSRAAALHLTGPRAFRPWTPVERNALRAAVANGDNIKIFAGTIDRTYHGCRYQSRIMGLVHPDNTVVQMYTKEEDARIREGYEKRESPREIAAAINRTLRGVYARAFVLGITGEKAGYRRQWSEEETKELRRLAAKGLSARDISAAIGRTRGATFRRANMLGIKIDSVRQGAKRHTKKVKKDT